MPFRKIRAPVVSLLFSLAFASGVPVAHADTYPSRPVQFVIPHAAGGGTDVFGRMLAERLSERLGSRFVPENRPGAGTALASGHVAKSAANGYTLLFNTAAHAINAASNDRLSFEPVDDFEFISKVGQVSLLLMVNGKYVDVQSPAELVDYLRKNPGKAQFGSAGFGTPMHLGGELLKRITGVTAVHVAYKGESAAVADLMGGQISFMLCSVSTCASRAKDGPLRALAVTSLQRSSLVPNVRTIAQSGYPGAEVNSWFFLAAPKGTPKEVVLKINAAVNEILGEKAFQQKAQSIGVQLENSTTPEETRSLVVAEIEKWRPIARSTAMEQ